HELPMRPERLNLLALPALDTRGRASEAPVLVPSGVPEAPLPLMAAEADAADIAVQADPKRSWPWLLALAAISCVVALTVATLLELRAEVTRMHQETLQTAVTLDQLRLETQSLRAQLQEASNS